MLLRILMLLPLPFLFCLQALAGTAPTLAETCLRDDAKRELSERILAVLTPSPTPAVVPIQHKGGLSFVPSSYIFSRILETPLEATVLNQLEELRFLPYSLSGVSVLMAVRDASGWDLEKTSKVLSVAKLQGNRIFVVWLGSVPPPAELRDLALGSEGKLWDLRDLNRLVLRHVCTDATPSEEMPARTW